ncbi:MAG TPA: hypothetical protein VD836_02065 [Solirubrobacteraceae bacterium]|nr:hypothetical protein [Solirubrobacteraceae bacterium]
MRARRHPSFRAAGAGVLATAAFAAPAAAAPAPCGGAPQITDAAGDGHHANTDVVAAWLSEEAGRLQSVVVPRVPVWEPAHDDSDAAGFALLYTTGGTTRYVRGEAVRGAPMRFDHGTWTAAGGFAGAGAVAGVAEPGALVLDLPPVLAGTVLARPFALTYDGVTAGEPHWVDRAPGATTAAGTEYGADVVAGSCGPAAPGGPGGTPGGATTTAVALDAPRRVRGGGRVVVGGRVTPARAGVEVELAATARRRTVTRRAMTQADGTFSLVLRVAETTRVRAVAEMIGSQTRTLRVVPRVRIRMRARPGGAVAVTGRIRPALPGRVLALRRGAVAPAATGRTRGGRFTLRLRAPRAGRYQVVFIPSGERAERSLSNTGVIR